MKKLFILIIIILCFLLILLSSLFFTSYPKEKQVIYEDYSELILSNSSWVDFKKSDFNSLILKTYSDNVLRIISSLENAIPVIFEINGGKFAEENKNNFVVVSGFSSSDVVYVYLPSEDTYVKTTSSLEELLENTVRFFIINNEEVVK